MCYKLLRQNVYTYVYVQVSWVYLLVCYVFERDTLLLVYCFSTVGYTACYDLLMTFVLLLKLGHTVTSLCFIYVFFCSIYSLVGLLEKKNKNITLVFIVIQKKKN